MNIKGKYMYSVINTYNGMHRTLIQIDKIHTNCINVIEGFTTEFSQLIEVDKWIDIETHIPNTNVLCLNTNGDVIIGIPTEYLNITHWKPLPFTKEIRMFIFGNRDDYYQKISKSYCNNNKYK